MFVNRIREIISLELGKEIGKDVFSSCHERGTNSQSMNLHQTIHLNSVIRVILIVVLECMYVINPPKYGIVQHFWV